jgi:RNA polymerase primary sigma factor
MSMPAHRRDHARAHADALSSYLGEIRAYRLLSRAEETALARRIHAGDAQALNRLVCGNLRFVVSIAKKYHQSHAALSDLINEGNLGLIRAAERFDETKGVRFISYAVWWIRQAIAQAMSEYAHVVHVPLSRVAVAHHIGRHANRLRQRLGREPTDSEIAEGLNLSDREITNTRAITRSTVSLDARVGAGDGSELLELLADDAAAATDRDAEAETEKCIELALHRLRPRDERVLRLYFGLGSGEPMTLEEIAARYGITRERVRQIKDRALAHIRRSDLSAALYSLRDR